MRDPLNRIIMEDIGLTVDSNNKIMDQDTRQELKYKEKNMRYSSNNSVVLTQSDMIFDPAANKALMGSLFTHYLNKVEEEDGTYVPVYYEVRNQEGQTGLVAKVHMEGSSEEESLETGFYNNDSLKYAEMIKKINGSSDTDLSEYDSEPKQDMTNQTKKQKKKRLIDFR